MDLMRSIWIVIYYSCVQLIAHMIRQTNNRGYYISDTYLTTEQLAERIHYDPRTIRNQLKDSVLLQGRHYFRPFGGRKILFIWETIEEDMKTYLLLMYGSLSSCYYVMLVYIAPQYADMTGPLKPRLGGGACPLW
jgi:hypothetical protein